MGAGAAVAAVLAPQADVVQHGVDWLGRDTVVLCALLRTLGTFAECAAATPAAPAVCAAALELLASPQVRA